MKTLIGGWVGDDWAGPWAEPGAQDGAESLASLNLLPFDSCLKLLTFHSKPTDTSSVSVLYKSIISILKLLRGYNSKH